MAEEFKILISTELNADSIKNLKKQIKSTEISPIKIKLDTSNLVEQISNIKIDPIKIKLDTSDIAKQLTNFKNQFQDLGGIKFNSSNKISGTKNISGITKAYKELLNISRQISKTEIRIAGLKGFDGHNNEITVLETQLKTLKNTYNELASTMQGTLSDSQLKDLNQIIKDTADKFDVLKAKIQDTKQKLANNSLNKFTNDTGKIEKISEQYANLKNRTVEVETAMKQFNQTISDMNAAKQSGNIDKIIQSYKEYENAIKQVNSEIKRASSTDSLNQSRTALSSQMDVWLKNNSAAAKKFGMQIKTLQNELKTCDATRLKGIKYEFAEITKQAKLAGVATRTFGDKLKSSFTSALSMNFSVNMLIMKAVTEIINALKEGINTIIDLDTALIDLQKTAQASFSQLTQFFYEANDIAKEFGSTTQEIIQSAADWSRLGYSLNDSKLMAQYSSMFKSISPNMDIDTATTGLVSVMKAYGIEAENVLDGVMSKINEVGNTAATSNTEIVEGLKQSAAAMAVMGDSLDETIALFTAGQEITQDASKVGNALRSISMRIRGYSEETEQLDEELSNIKGEVIDLTKVASNNYKGISLFTDETQQEYKSVYTYLGEIANIYDELGAKEQQNLLESLFGKNRASVGAAILKNFSAAENAMNTMSNSAGSAEREMDTISESLEYKLNRLSETVTGIMQNLFQREDMKMVIDGLTEVLEIIDTLTEHLGLFGTISIGAGLIAFIKNFETLKNLGQFTLDIGNFDVAGKGIKGIIDGLKEYAKTAKIAKIASSTLSDTEKIAALTSIGLSEAQAATAVSNTAAAGAAGLASFSFKALAISLKEATAGVIAFLLSNPIGWAILATTAIFGVVKVVDALTESFDEAKEASQEAREEYNQIKQEVESLNSELEQTQQRIAELKAQGSLTITEKEELSRLEAQNSQLQTQLEIKQKLAEYENKEAAEKANNVLTKKSFNYIGHTSSIGVADVPTESESVDIIDYVIKKQKELNALEEKKKALEEKHASTPVKKSKWWQSSTQYEREVTQIEDLDKQIRDLEGDISESVQDINEEYDALFNSQGGIVKGCEKTVKRIDEMYKTIQDSSDIAKTAQEQVDELLNRPSFSNTKEKLVSIAETMNGIDVEYIKNAFPEISDAAQKSGIDIQDVVNTINSIAGTINVDEVKSQLKDSFELKEEQDKWESFIDSINDVEELKLVYGIYESSDTSAWNIADWKQAIADAKSGIDETTDAISVLFTKATDMVSGIEKIKEILNSQSAGTSLSLDDFNSDELADYTSALEYHNGVLQLNSDKVNELIKVKSEETLAQIKSNKANEQAEYLKNAADIEKLRQKLKDKNFEEGESAKKVKENINALLEENNTIKANCDSYSLMASSINEATSAYQNWKNAQNASESGDMFDDTLTALKTINDILNNTSSDNYGRTGRQDYKTSVDLIVPDTIDKDNERKVKAYLKSVKDLFVFDDDGNYSGLNLAKFCEKATEKGLLVLDKKSGEYKLAGKKTMEEFAKGLNVSVSLVQAMFGELEEFNVKFDWSEGIDTLGDLGVSANEAAENLRNIKKYKNLSIRMNVSDIDNSQDAINILQETINEMDTVKATAKIDSSAYEYANTIIRYCVEQQQQLCQPQVMDVDTSVVEGKLGNAIKLLQDFHETYNTFTMNKKLGLDTSKSKTKLKELKEEIQSIDNIKIMKSLEVDTSNIETIEASLQNDTTHQIMFKAGIDDSAIVGYTADEADRTATLTYDVNSKAVDDYQKVNVDKDAIVKFDIDTKAVDLYLSKNLEKEVNLKVNTNSDVKESKSKKASKKSGKHKVNGTAYVNGTAKAKGDWGSRKEGTALIGELGQEIVVDVRTGKWYTVGDNGAEFVDIPKNAIVFNHEQTKDLLSHGFVASRAASFGNAYVSGNAYASGTLNSISGLNKDLLNKFNKISDALSKKTDSSKSSNKSSSNRASSDKKEKTALEKFQEWIEKLFDWIEIKVKRQTERIDNYINKAENYKDIGSYNKSAKNYNKAVKATSTQISYEQKAAKKYDKQADKIMKQAVSIGVVSMKQADNIKKQVKNGSINIKSYNKQIQEVIKNFQEWHEKSKDAKKAIQELHNNIRTYIKDLKDMRDAQRSVKIDRIDTYTSIGTNGHTYTTRTQNDQLDYSNSQLNKQNKAYNAEVNAVAGDVKKIGKTGIKAVNNALKSKDAKGKSKKSKAYKKALNNAKKAINAKKAVSNADLKIIKLHSVSVYNKLYAYNISLDNLELAKLEQAMNYAANSAEKFENVAQKYTNKNDKVNNDISLLQSQTENAISAKDKNNILNEISSKYDKIITNDKAEITNYSNKENTNAKTIKNQTGLGTKYNNLGKKKKVDVRHCIQKAKNAVRDGIAIDASVMSELAKYYSKGYITKAFYLACENYNNAIEYRKEAEARLEIDKQTAIQEKAAIGTEKFSNVEQEHTNKLNDTKSYKNWLSVNQSIRTTKGMTLTVSDYQDMIKYSKQEEHIYSDMISSLEKLAHANVSSGLWQPNSQEYIDAMNSIKDYQGLMLECRKEQEELNNEIAQLPYTIFDKAINLLQSMSQNFQSLLSIKTTRGLDKTSYDILSEIDYINTEISKQTERKQQLWEDYQKASGSGDNVYGGKDADEWLTEYYEADTAINNLKADVEELNNEIAQLPYTTYEKALSLLDSIANYNKSIADLTKAQGRDLSANDYMTQIRDNDAKLQQYESERVQAYADYIRALGSADSVYGGMTSDEWLIKYYELGSTINEIKSDNEDIKDALRDDVYWRTFERAHKSAQSLENILSGIAGLIDDNMLYKDDKLTEFGVAQIANVIKQYETAREEVRNYTNDIQNLNSLYAQGWYNQDEFNEKLSELQDGLFNAASSMKSYISEIIDMNKNLAQSELDALFKLIDARNDALSAKKNYYDYDKTIKSKTKDIETLEAQIAALEGIETAEAKAQKAKLEANLSDAKDDLKDTIVNHSFELSKDALNELKDILQEEFDDKWNNISQNLEEIQKLISAANELTAAESHIIGSALNKLLSFYGINSFSTDLNQFGTVTGYASGTKNVNKNKMAWTQENGQEFIVRKSDGAILTPLSKGDSVIPNNLSDNLFNWGKYNPQDFAGNLTQNIPNIPKAYSPTTSIEQHYDSLLKVEGNVDSTVIADLEKFAKTFYQGAYKYTVNEIAKDARKKGIKT